MGETRELRGTWRDWPVAVMVAAVVIAMFTDGAVLAFVLFWFGVLSLLIRRGAFSPRKDG